MSLRDQLASIYDTFSRRSVARREGYSADKVDESVRGRILLLLRDVYTGKWHSDALNPRGDYFQEFWEQVHNVLEHLYGRTTLSGNSQATTPWEDGIAFVLACEAAEFFDFLEAIFKTDCTWRVVRERNDLVDALNLILQHEDHPFQLTPVVTRKESYGQNGGYSTSTISLPQVIRVDEEVAHTEAVMPALSALADPAYAGANDEFRRALADYRKGDYEDCLGKCGSAFESVLKVLCDKNRITFDPNKDTAGPLLDRVLAKSALDAVTFKEPLFGIARMRNRLSSSHGGGTKVKKVERPTAQYAVTSTAAAIVLLVHELGH